MSSARDLKVTCGVHGVLPSAVVCRHMLRARWRRVGFVENSDDPDDLQAWCFACERMYLLENERTEAFVAFSDPAIVCVKCYAKLKARHDV